MENQYKSPKLNTAMEFAETPDERDKRRRDATKKRLKVLSAVFCAVIIGRLFIKNPPPPPPPIHEKKPIRALPGMINRIPVADRTKINPQLLAQLQSAEYSKSLLVKDLLAKKEHPQKAPAEMALKKPAAISAPAGFTYAEALLTRETSVFESVSPIDEKTIVQFRSGGWLEVRGAVERKDHVVILMNPSIGAIVPRLSVATIFETAKGWKEPVPHGYVELKPAPGITIQVANQTAKRISVF